MAVIDLGNGNVLKDGVFFGDVPTFKTKYLYDKETGRLNEVPIEDYEDDGNDDIEFDDYA